MLTIQLALRSLVNRRLTTLLTIASIALSVALLVGVETVRRGIRDSFAGTIRGTDLIVGARGGTQQLLLSSIFGIGFPNGSVSWETYERWAGHGAVKWTIPISLGDSYRGFRVVGTTAAFFEHYRYRNDGTVTVAEGKLPETDRDVVVGSEVAKALKLSIGASLAVTHGLGSAAAVGISDHDEHPFVLVGILNQTSTPIDRSVYVTLQGIEAMHAGMPKAAAPVPRTTAGAATTGGTAAGLARDGPVTGDQGQHDDHDHAHGTDGHQHDGDDHAHGTDGHQHEGDGHAHGADGDHEVDQITAFLVGTKNRGDAFRLQREMNTDFAEPLTAIVPAMSLTELWHTIGYAEDGARIITLAVVIVGLMGMLVALYSTLQERRREMAILRSLGAGPGRIAALLVFESGLLALLGAATGLAAIYGFLFVASGMIERHFGIFIPITAPQQVEWLYLGGVIVAGLLVGLIPAWRAYRNTLQDGLAIRL